MHIKGYTFIYHNGGIRSADTVSCRYISIPAERSVVIAGGIFRKSDYVARFGDNCAASDIRIRIQRDNDREEMHGVERYSTVDTI